MNGNLEITKKILSKFDLQTMSVIGNQTRCMFNVYIKIVWYIIFGMSSDDVNRHWNKHSRGCSRKYSVDIVSTRWSAATFQIKFSQIDSNVWKESTYNVTLKSEISNFRSVTSNHPKLFLVLSRMMKIGLMHGNQCKPRPNFLENNCYN